MTLQATIATPDDREDWDRFIATRPEADILQLWAWGEAVRDAGAPAGTGWMSRRRKFAKACTPL